MIEKQRTNDAFVIGIYQPIGGLIHALTMHDNPHQHDAPLRTICGSFQIVHYASPFASPVEMADLSKTTCKRCLRILRQRSLLRVEKARGDKPIKLLGIYRYSYNQGFPVHALVKREPKPSDNPTGGIPPLRSLCSDYPDVYRSDDYQGDEASNVTCTKCLRMLGTPMSPRKPSQKKFFLVSYNGGNTVSNIYNLEELIQDVHRFKPTIDKILLIDSYREISVKEVIAVTDKAGNKITEEDL